MLSLNCPSCKDFNQTEVSTLEEDIVSSHAEENSISDNSMNQSEPSSNKRSDSSHHLLYECPAFWKIRKNKNFSNDKDLCDFMRLVIEHRMENDENWCIYAFKWPFPFFKFRLKYAAATRAKVKLTARSLGIMAIIKLSKSYGSKYVMLSKDRIL